MVIINIFSCAITVMASGGPQKLQSLKVSSTTPEKIDVDAIVDRILKLTHKLDSDIYQVMLIKSKLTEVNAKFIEANANGSRVDMSIISDMKQLEFKISESGINAALNFIENLVNFIENLVDSFLSSLQERIK